MNETPASQMTDQAMAKKTVPGKLLGWLRRQGSLSIEGILKAAEKGRLDRLLTSHYTVYTDANWREKLHLCRDLKDAGYLQADFKEDFDGTPIFLDGPARITIAGRDYLARIKLNKPWRRAVIWIVAFLLGLLTSFVVKWLDVLIDVYAKKHGLR